MSPTTNEIAALVQKLERISAVELDCSAERFASAEKRTAAGLIAHLCEILRRGTHLDLGYGSLFEYVTRRLGFDEGAAGLRIHVARAARRRPELLGALAEGRVSLSVAALLVPHLTSGNVDRLLSDCAGKTKREAQEYLVGLAPKPIVKAGIRAAAAPAAAAATSVAPAAPATSVAGAGGRSIVYDPASAPGIASTPERALPNGRLALAPAEQPLQLAASGQPVGQEQPIRPKRRLGAMEPAMPEIFNFRFSAGREFRSKLERLAEVLNVVDPVGSMSQLLERAVDFMLERRDPMRRLQRRMGREARRSEIEAQERALTESCTVGQPESRPADVPGAAELPPRAERNEALAARESPVRGESAAPQHGTAKRESAASPERPASRHVPVSLWDRVLHRAGYRCEYQGLDGRRCTQRTGLEPDHFPTPFSRSRRHDENGIRAHCAAHNRRTAELIFGQEFMERKMARV